MASAAASRGENLCFLKAADVLMVDRRDLLGLEVTKHGLLDHFSKKGGSISRGRMEAESPAPGKGQFLQHEHFTSSTSLALSQPMFCW